MPDQPPHTPSNEGAGRTHRVDVWDIPTRLFHWALVALVAISFITAKLGITYMTYHELSGVAILTLLLFRILWGFFGSEASRFNAFVRGPAAVFGYAATLLKRKSSRHLGHNPLGGWSVLALLVSLLLQAVTGLFANDDILTEGPLFNLVSKETSDWLTGIHHINQTVLTWLVAIHVGAILFHLIYKRENLIGPMITGVKQWPQPAQLARRSGWRALVIAALLALAVYALVYAWM